VAGVDLENPGANVRVDLDNDLSPQGDAEFGPGPGASPPDRSGLPDVRPRAQSESYAKASGALRNGVLKELQQRAQPIISSQRQQFVQGLTKSIPSLARVNWSMVKTVGVVVGATAAGAGAVYYNCFHKDRCRGMQ
jgi:hypothetical protein